MTPVVLKTKNLKIKIYPKDHRPPHVHILGPGVSAKIEIESLECIANYGFTLAEIRRIQNFLSLWQVFLLESWNDYQE